jgi:hypothetical protein
MDSILYSRSTYQSSDHSIEFLGIYQQDSLDRSDKHHLHPKSPMRHIRQWPRSWVRRPIRHRRCQWSPRRHSPWWWHQWVRSNRLTVQSQQYVRAQGWQCNQSHWWWSRLDQITMPMKQWPCQQCPWNLSKVNQGWARWPYRSNHGHTCD